MSAEFFFPCWEDQNNAWCLRVITSRLFEVNILYIHFHISQLAFHGHAQLKLVLELIQTQMAQKPMLRAEVYARALRASQNVKQASISRLKSIEMKFQELTLGATFYVVLLTQTWCHPSNQFYQIYDYSQLAIWLFCALPPFVKISFWAHLLVTVAFTILY